MAQGAADEADGQKGAQPRRPRALLRLVRWLLLLLLAAAAVLALAVYYLPVLARPVILKVAEDAGLAGLDFQIDAIGWRETKISGLSLAASSANGETQSDAFFIGSARLTYEINDLLRGRVDSLELKEVVARGQITADGQVRLDALDQIEGLLGGDGADTPSSPTPPRLSRVVLRDGLLVVATPYGAHDVRLGGVATLDNGVSAEVALEVDGPAAEGGGALTVQQDGAGWLVTLADLEMAVSTNGLGARLAMADGRADLRIDNALSLDGTASGFVRFDRAAGNSSPVTRASARVSIAGMYDAGEARAELAECTRVALEWDPSQEISTGVIDLCPDGSTPLFAWSQGASTASGEIGGAARIPSTSFRYGDSASGSLPELAISLSQQADGPLLVRSGISGGRIELPAQDIQLAQLAGEITFAPGGTGEAGTVEITRAIVEDLRAAKRFAPLQAAASVSLQALGEDGLSGGTLAGPVSLRVPGGQMLVRGTVSHSLSSGKGWLSLASGTLLFAEQGVQPQTLAPVLRGIVASVSGEVTAKGRFAWSRNGIAASPATISMQNVGLQAPAARFDGISGTIDFSSLMPLRTDGPQAVSIGVVDPGVPITGGQALVSVRGDGEVVIENAQWPFAGGQLVLTSGALNTKADVQNAELAALKVDLAQLLTLIDMDGLSGEGVLGGKVPIQIRDGTVFVTKAQLSAESGGVLRYSSPGTDAAAERSEGANIAFKALENFRFEVLSVELDGPMDGDLALTVELRGANPELLEGYPVHLTVRTEGAFLELLRRGTVGFRALDVVRGTDETGGVTIERVGDAP